MVGRIIFRIVVDAAIPGGEFALGLGRQAVGQRRLKAKCRGEQKGKRAHHEALTLMEPSAITVPDRILPLSMLRTLTRSPAHPAAASPPSPKW